MTKQRGTASEEAAVEPPATSTASPDFLLAAYRWMCFSRQFDETAFSLQRQGRLGTYSPVRGQEASVLGTAMALDPGRDWLVPSYREVPAMLRHGLPLWRLLLYFLGNPVGGWIPPEVRMLPVQISLASQIPHAAGLAWGIRHQGKDGVVMAYCGDGASSEGDFHEALNLAGVRRAPLVMVVQNNQWAISTPREKQSAATSLADRGLGYGIRHESVDGNDFFAVHRAAAEAVARARQGEGPTLIETVTYRLGPHNTADDPTRYQADERLQAAAERDPLPRMRAALDGLGLLEDGVEDAWAAEMKEEIAVAVRTAEEHPIPAAHQIFDHVYADPPARVVQQRSRLVDGRVDSSAGGA